VSSQPHNPVDPLDPLAQLRHDLCLPAKQIIGYSEMLQEGAEAGGHNACVSDLQKIQFAARHLLGLVNSKLNAEALAGVVSPVSSEHTVAHRRANYLPADGHGETGFFARFNGHVLVADDNADNRDMLLRRLQRQGMRAETATNGRQALQLVRNRPFDVVLLDIMMPELDGFSVLQQLKADPQTRHIPVIMISEVDEMDKWRNRTT